MTRADFIARVIGQLYAAVLLEDHPISTDEPATALRRAEKLADRFEATYGFDTKE